uniref:FIIND domain-containing protein n=1 Tax=Calidris pygmaea TaxID=425635 RepID=A0A8C3JRU6_9CHAR
HLSTHFGRVSASLCAFSYCVPQICPLFSLYELFPPLDTEGLGSLLGSTFQKPCPRWHEPVVPPTRRADLPRAGVFQCSLTGLSFEVKSAVTITYRYDTWARRLSEADRETWVPAGPLFHIEVQPGVVQAVYLPHFICLAEDVNTSLCSIAHFKSGEMTLEKPTRLIAFSAVLENPSFSLLGVLLWRLRSALNSALNSLPMHSSVLIFQTSNAANTFRFYLIPDDNSVKQVRWRELARVKRG